MLNLYQLQSRTEIPKYVKEIKENEDSNIVKTKRIKLYEYYLCDYCGDEIKINQKQDERTGGTVTFPHTLTKSKEITMVLCNKCLNKVIAEIEKMQNIKIK